MSGAYTANGNASDAWEPFELPDGGVVGEVRLLRGDETDGGTYYAGFWRVSGEDLPAPFRYETAKNETIYVIEGELTIAVHGGLTMTLRPGDMASFTAGTRTTWELSKTPFKEAFVLS